MFGSHLSIAGGMTNALAEAERLRMDTVQVFTKNQQQWNAKPLAEAAADEWLAELDRLGWRDRTVSHASYLINLASPDDELWEKSIGLMTEEIERCERLSIPFLVHHPGAYTTSDERAGMKRIAGAYRRLVRSTGGYRTALLLENTVGSGSNLGRRFEQLADLRGMIIDQTGAPERVGFCFDTCHAHAGGYDMSSRGSADAVLDEFDRACGLVHMRAIHVNDSAAAFDSRKDRHAHIGEGAIGRPPGVARRALRESGFAAVVRRPELAGVPKILETPKGTDERGKSLDAMNLSRLRRLQRT